MATQHNPSLPPSPTLLSPQLTIFCDVAKKVANQKLLEDNSEKVGVTKVDNDKGNQSRNSIRSY